MIKNVADSDMIIVLDMDAGILLSVFAGGAALLATPLCALHGNHNQKRIVRCITAYGLSYFSCLTFTNQGPASRLQLSSSSRVLHKAY